MNHIETIRGNYKGIIDSTLREGEQFAGQPLPENDPAQFYKPEFTVDQATMILQFCHVIGIEKAEVPNALAPGMDGYIRQLVALKDRPRLTSHIRNDPRDLRAVIATGAEDVSVLTTVDPARISRMHLTKDQYADQLIQVIREAKAHNLGTRVSVEHSWNTDFHAAMEVFLLAEQNGVDRIGLADTIGTASHWEVAEKVTAVRKILKTIDIELHFHNDGGLNSVTNMLEGMLNGGNYASTAFGGYGERTGITPTSAWLTRLYTLDPLLVKNYTLRVLTMAERYVAHVVGVELPHNLITSPNAFAHKAGIHLNGIKAHGTQLYEPFHPDVVGNSRVFVTGTSISGKTTQEEMIIFQSTQGEPQ